MHTQLSELAESEQEKKIVVFPKPIPLYQQDCFYRRAGSAEKALESLGLKVMVTFTPHSKPIDLSPIGKSRKLSHEDVG